MKIKAGKRTILYLFTAIFFAVFYYFLPLAGDDWAWGSDIGMQRLGNAFDGYNGRYLGNILIILITRSMAARLILCTATMLTLIFTLSRIFDNLSDGKQHNEGFIIAFSSVLALVLPNQIAFGDIQPFQIFGSTIGWLSGFTNYAVPTVLILIFYNVVTSRKEAKPIAYPLLFIDGVLACLCVEHYSLFCIMLSLGIIAYRYLFDKKICKISLSFFLGSVVGCGIMFTNSSYRLMQKGDVSSNQRAVGFIGSIKKYASYIFPDSSNKILILFFEAALLIIILASLALLGVKLYKSIRSRGISGILPVICMVAMTIPLLFTNSGKEIYVVAPRCYLLQYFMLVIYIFGRLSRGNKLNGKGFRRSLTICFCILLAVTCAVYCRLDYMGAMRDKQVDEALQNGYDTVEILEYPKDAEHIQWSSNFIKKDTYLERYKKYKAIPTDKTTKITKISD